MRTPSLWNIALTLVLVSLCLPGLAQTAIPDFSFIHMSDNHAARRDSAQCIAQVATLGPIAQSPYGVTAPAPSFAIMTGDMTEFGGGYGNSWQALQSYVKDIKIPVYFQEGNHDGTWDSLRPTIRKLYGFPSYSFDLNGCHFIQLDTAGLQDPRPFFTVEQLIWLEKDLKKTGTKTPIFIGFHHPIESSEYASDFDRDRFLDMIRPYNVVTLMVGHGHSSVHTFREELDEVQGGSTMDGNNDVNKTGYAVYSVMGGKVRAAYKFYPDSDARKPLMEKPMPTGSTYPKITILSPDPNRLASGVGDLAAPTPQRVNQALTAAVGTIPAGKLVAAAKVAVLAKGKGAAFVAALAKEFHVTLAPGSSAEITRGTLDGVAKVMDAAVQAEMSAPIRVAAKIDGAPAAIQSAEYDIDGDIKAPLTLDGDTYKAEIATDKLTPGAHYLRINFKGEGKSVYHKSVRIFVENGKTYARWRAFLGGSSKSAPTVAGGVVYVGAADGKLYAFDAKTGQPKWSFTTDGDILGQALVVEKTVYIGAGDGKFYAVDTKTGKQKWAFEAEKAIFSSPIFAQGKVLFGCNSGAFYAVDPKTGKEAWTNRDATYSIEIKPFADGSTVYYGAWDTYVYAVNIADGKLIWKSPSAGARSGAARYYSPADCGPVASGGLVFCADRNMAFSAFNAKTGELVRSGKSCSATGIAENGQAIYLRKTGGDLEKTDLSGNSLWSTACAMGYVPTAPTEKDGVAYATSGLGLVSAISAQDGAVRWQYQASPQLWVMSPVTAQDGITYVSGHDGTLTAISNR